MSFDHPVAPVLVAGIGNILLGDDGFGPQAIARLQSEYEFTAEVELLDLGTPALDFAEYLTGRRVVVLLDAMACGGEPGAVLTVSQVQLRELVGEMRLSAHQPTLNESLQAADTAGLKFEQITLIGVVGSSYDVGTELSGPVSEAMPKVLQMVCDILSSHGVELRKREKPLELQAWWSRQTPKP